MNSTEKAIMKFQSAITLFSLGLDLDSFYEDQGSMPQGLLHVRILLWLWVSSEVNLYWSNYGNPINVPYP